MMNDVYAQQAMEATKAINSMEDKVAMGWYGCKWADLDYDDKELVTFEAYDRLG